MRVVGRDNGQWMIECLVHMELFQTAVLSLPKGIERECELQTFPVYVLFHSFIRPAFVLRLLSMEETG